MNYMKTDSKTSCILSIAHDFHLIEVAIYISLINVKSTSISSATINGYV